MDARYCHDYIKLFEELGEILKFELDILSHPDHGSRATGLGFRYGNQVPLPPIKI